MVPAVKLRQHRYLLLPGGGRRRPVLEALDVEGDVAHPLGQIGAGDIGAAAGIGHHRLLHDPGPRSISRAEEHDAPTVARSEDVGIVPPVKLRQHRHLLLPGGGRRRPVLQAATDIMWTQMSPDNYLNLVVSRGWAASAYRKWLVDSLAAALLASKTAPRR